MQGVSLTLKFIVDLKHALALIIICAPICLGFNGPRLHDFLYLALCVLNDLVGFSLFGLEELNSIMEANHIQLDALA